MMRLVRPDGVELVLADGSRRLFDHGPFTFGGWEAVPLAVGNSAEKCFASARGARNGEVEVLLLAENPGPSRWRSGESEYSRPLRKGENRLRIPVTLGEGGLCSVTALELPAGTALVFDAQRQYGRSRLDGRELPGEWCFRLTLR